MPENALRAVDVNYIVPVAEMGLLLAELCKRETPEIVQEVDEGENEITSREIRIALQDKALEDGIMDLGGLSPYACPECHGVLTALKENGPTRFRCHTGHAYSADSLLASITENIEESLWIAIRGIKESTILLNHMGDHFAERNQPKLASLYFKKAKEAEQRAEIVRQTVLNHEQLSADSIRNQVGESENGTTASETESQ